MRKFIKQLEVLANENLQQGGSPYSALVVLNDEVIATGVNKAHETNDPTQHAELLAIQQALQSHMKDELQSAIIYASGEPCPMCYSAAQYVGIQHIYFTVSREEIIEMNKSPQLPTIPKKHIPTDSTKAIFKRWEL